MISDDAEHGPAGDLDDLITVEPVLAGIAIRLQEAPEHPQMVLRVLSLPVDGVAEQHRGWSPLTSGTVIAYVDPQLAGPGPAMPRTSTGTGVSSACSLPVWSVCFANASTSGCSRALVLPTQSASVERSSATPSVDLTLPIQRQMIGIIGHQHVSDQPGPARPRAIGRDGASLCTIRSPREHASFGRPCGTTRKLAGTYSSISEVSSPSRRIGPPQSGHVQAGS